MRIQQPCAIRDCPKIVRLEAAEYTPGRFALCDDCETSVLLDFMLNMEQGDYLPPQTTANFAVVFNTFRRERKGAALTHRSGVVTTMREIGRTPNGVITVGKL